jgi:hypothetical protein
VRFSLPVVGISPNVGNMTASLLNGLFTSRLRDVCCRGIEDTDIADKTASAEGAILYSLR